MNHKLLVLLISLGLAAAAVGQTGKLSGTISGQNAENNSGTAVILTNVNTGASQRVTVNPDGSFSANLAPGTYRVEVERNGRRQTATQNLEIAAGANSQMTMQIEGGANGETVQIEAQAPALEDEPPAVGRAYSTRSIRELPVFDRNYQELNGLPSGTTPPAEFSSVTTDPQRSRIYNTNGLPAFVNENLEDGTQNREPVTQTLSVRVLPDEAAKELQVETSNYPADLGFAAGAISNVSTRPGTNGAHGSLFGFFTNDRLSAHDPLVPAGVGEPTTHHSQYGGTLGGSLIPDKLFLFLSYQGSHDAGSALQYATVPTAAMLGGNFSGLGVTLFNPTTGVTTGPSAGTGRSPFAGGIIPAGSINPASRAILGALPGPNLPGFANNYAADVPQGIDSNVGDAKLDYRFSDALTGYLRYGISQFNANQGSIFGPIIGNPTGSGLRNHHAALSLVGNYHGILGELRLGYSRYRNQINSLANAGTLSPELASLGFTSGSLPPLTIEGLGTLGTAAGLPSKDVDNIYDGTANFHIVRGGNQISFGVTVRAERSDGFLDMLIGPFGPFGGFSFGPGATTLAGAAPGGPNSAFAGSIAAFLLGAPTTGGIFTPSVTPSFRQNQYSAYAQDLFHLGSRISIDLGARYDIFSPVTPNHTSGSFFNPTSGVSDLSTLLNRGDYDLNNISPRVGVAFQATKHTVFRA
ncbi:MAG TPA: TonB-dependent receptor, partial [Bryobacteraceae bacterium]|nr:TonB-dependent receptor [Bryobacteraceae bacterium]